MTCPICNAKTEAVFKAEVLNRHSGEFFYCQQCGYLGIANPYWLGEAYESAIATMDTGVAMRNIALAKRCIPVLYFLLSQSRSTARCLDFAGGTGLFTRLMRDAGFDYYWADKYADNVFARGFEYDPSLGPCEVVTAFEVLEHAVDPLALVREALTLTPASYLLFSTELFEGAPPAPDTWWYYSFETGQHVSFFQRRTLETMASRLGMHFTSYRGLHAFSKRPAATRLRASAGPIRRVALPWAKRRMKSRTLADLEVIRARSRNRSSD